MQTGHCTRIQQFSILVNDARITDNSAFDSVLQKKTDLYLQASWDQIIVTSHDAKERPTRTQRKLIQGGGYATIVAPDELHRNSTAMCSDPLCDYFTGLINGTVIDDNDLLFRIWIFQDAIQTPSNEPCMIERRDQNRYQRPVRMRLFWQMQRHSDCSR